MRSNQRFLAFISLATGVSAIATAQPVTTTGTGSGTLKVQRATDTTERRLPGGKQLPVEAFNVSSTMSSINEDFEIVGVNGDDLANRPGLEDERDRVFHQGTEIEFKNNPNAFAASLNPSTVQPVLKPDWMLAHYIDVGQGNATLLEFSCGAMLVDTGGQTTDNFNSTKRLAEYLTDFFKRRTDLNNTLALVALTHPHADHTAGVAGLLDRSTYNFKIGSVVVNAQSNGSGWPNQRKLIEAAKSAKIPTTLVTNESIRRSDGLTNDKIDPLKCASVDPSIRVLWGSDHSAHKWTSNGNNHSVVLRVDFGESSFLFTGDMEEDAQPEFIGSYVRNPDVIDADVYQVGHHASRNGTTAALLKVMTPEIAVIGSGNPADEEPGWSAYKFGHPNRIAIELLSNPDFGVSMSRPKRSVAVGIKGGNSSAPPRYAYQDLDKAIFSTGWDGDIVIAASADGKKIVQTE